MARYLITAIFNGVHKVVVEAKNQKQAEELYYEGQWEDDSEDTSDSNDYEIVDTEKL